MVFVCKFLNDNISFQSSFGVCTRSAHIIVFRVHDDEVNGVDKSQIVCSRDHDLAKFGDFLLFSFSFSFWLIVPRINVNDSDSVFMTFYITLFAMR